MSEFSPYLGMAPSGTRTGPAFHASCAVGRQVPEHAHALGGRQREGLAVDQGALDEGQLREVHEHLLSLDVVHAVDARVGRVQVADHAQRRAAGIQPCGLHLVDQLAQLLERPGIERSGLVRHDHHVSHAQGVTQRLGVVATAIHDHVCIQLGLAADLGMVLGVFGEVGAGDRGRDLCGHPHADDLATGALPIAVNDQDVAVLQRTRRGYLYGLDRLADATFGVAYQD